MAQPNNVMENIGFNIAQITTSLMFRSINTLCDLVPELSNLDGYTVKIQPGSYDPLVFICSNSHSCTASNSGQILEDNLYFSCKFRASFGKRGNSSNRWYLTNRSELRHNHPPRSMLAQPQPVSSTVIEACDVASMRNRYMEITSSSGSSPVMTDLNTATIYQTMVITHSSNAMLTQLDGEVDEIELVPPVSMDAIANSMNQQGGRKTRSMTTPLMDGKFLRFIGELLNPQNDFRILKPRTNFSEMTRSEFLHLMITLRNESIDVHAMYIQMYKTIIDDAMLDEIAETLIANKGIYAANIGEAPLITLNGMYRFMVRVSDSHLSFVYFTETQTESYYKMKSNLKIVLRNNRAKPENFKWKLRANSNIVDQVKLMWWNPSQSEFYNSI